MTKRNKPGYLLPEVPQPDENICICVPIPKDWRHIQAFLGQIMDLGYWYTWERDTAHTGKMAAQPWREIYECIDQEINCKMAGNCGCEDRTPTNVRYTADGLKEVSYDGGATWESGDELDERFTSPVWSPLGGADGQDKRCAAANSIITALKDEKAASSAVLGAAGGVAGLVVAVAAFVASTGVGLVAGIILALIGGILTAIVNGGQAAFDSSFDDEFWADVLCILFCTMEDDASFTKDQWLSVISQVKALSPYPANDWTQGMIKSVGPVGLTNIARSQRSGALSCDGCECEAACDSADNFTFGNVTNQVTNPDGSVTFTVQSVDDGFGVQVVKWKQYQVKMECCEILDFHVVVASGNPGFYWSMCTDNAGTYNTGPSFPGGCMFFAQYIQDFAYTTPFTMIMTIGACP